MLKLVEGDLKKCENKAYIDLIVYFFELPNTMEISKKEPFNLLKSFEMRLEICTEVSLRKNITIGETFNVDQDFDVDSLYCNNSYGSNSVALVKDSEGNTAFVVARDKAQMFLRRKLDSAVKSSVLLTFENASPGIIEKTL